MGIPTTQVQAELGHIFGGAAFVQPTTIWVALLSASPADDTEYGTELSGNGYLRIGATSAWDINGRYAGNSTVVTFPTATGGAWSAVVAFGLALSSATTSFIRVGAVDSTRTAAEGDTLRFSTDALKVTYNASTDL